MHWINWTIGAGLDLRRVDEPEPTAEALRHYPELSDAAMVPYFFLIDAHKR